MRLKVRGFHQGQGCQSLTPAKGRIYVSNRFSASGNSLAPRLGPYMSQRSTYAILRRSSGGTCAARGANGSEARLDRFALALEDRRGFRVILGPIVALPPVRRVQA